MSIKYVVSCGCSWARGMGSTAKEVTRVSALFSKRYNARDINIAREGGSNQRILRKIIEWISNNQEKLNETFFLIGLTEMSRYEYWDDISEEWTRSCGSPSSTSAERRQDYEKLRLSFIQDKEKDHQKTGNIVLSLLGIFKKYNTKHLIYDARGAYNSVLRSEKIMEHFEVPEPFEPSKCWDLIHQDKHYYSEQGWDEFCGGLNSNNTLWGGSRTLNDMINVKRKDEKGMYAHNDCGHPNAEANRLWYEILVKYAEKQNIL